MKSTRVPEKEFISAAVGSKKTLASLDTICRNSHSRHNYLDPRKSKRIVRGERLGWEMGGCGIPRGKQVSEQEIDWINQISSWLARVR